MASFRFDKYLPRPTHGLDMAVGAGVLAAAATAGIAGVRHRIMPQRTPTAAPVQLELPEPTWRGTVTADDGVPLAVREIGPAEAPLSVVFIHGYCQSAASWSRQAAWLRDELGDSIRMVLFDQRGHGQSGTPTPQSCTIAQTAQDLAAVIHQRVPEGPLVLVGHSMGGMTTMALGGVGSDIVPRIRGIALIATAARGLNEGGIPRMLLNPAGHAVVSVAAQVPWLTDHIRNLIHFWTKPIVHGGSFGDQKTASAVLNLNEQMIDSTESTTILNFFESLQGHDETEGLRALSHIPGVVIAGLRDRMVPPGRSDEIAAHWPAVRLVRVPGAGHMVHMECPELVNEELLRLLHQAGLSADAD
ncbi:alpha/beta hydrolase [Corynebacterium sp. TAE3-ERU12]|uniref:alpha/beta fold hydrolase n=1 Tax=Corynebacterium sp. TAE3-ERU12 TaxID=2849491 RepID=UPI001C44C1A5|nr:alpha/beta hydrolase [Corynebacterium sp. TAE3-ERU12]MBV7294718.1 alpha/beta hydrolase [Corynebacterium sp. TAE3-ERU12]